MSTIYYNRPISRQSIYHYKSNNRMKEKESEMLNAQTCFGVEMRDFKEWLEKTLKTNVHDIVIDSAYGIDHTMTLKMRLSPATFDQVRYRQYCQPYIPKVIGCDLESPKIKKVIFNEPATIVYWTDGTKTVVKCGLDEWDPEKGLAMAISKKMLGNEGNYYETFKKWLPESEKAKIDNYTQFMLGIEE